MTNRRTAACTVKGCGRPRMTVGGDYCRAHWKRWRANIEAGKRNPAAGIDKTPLRARGRPRTQPQTCTQRGCAKPTVAHGLCDTHYRAAQRA